MKFPILGSFFLTARRSNQSISKEINPEYSLEGLMLKLKPQYFGHLMWRANLLKKTLMLGKIEGRSRRGWQENEMVGWYHQFNGHELGQTLGEGEGQGNLVWFSPWGWKQSDATWWLHNRNNNLPIRKLTQALSLIHQRAERRHKKNHNPTAARTKTTL